MIYIFQTYILKWHHYLSLRVISHLSKNWFNISILCSTVPTLTFIVIFFLFQRFQVLPAKNVRKHYPYNDTIRSQSQQSKKQFINLLVPLNKVPFVVISLSWIFSSSVLQLQKCLPHIVASIMSS